MMTSNGYAQPTSPTFTTTSEENHNSIQNSTEGTPYMTTSNQHAQPISSTISTTFESGEENWTTTKFNHEPDIKSDQQSVDLTGIMTDVVHDFKGESFSFCLTCN